MSHKLSVTVRSATNVPNVEKGGASDPYAKITFKGKTEKTKSIDNELNPSWNETFEFEVDDLKPGDVLNVKVHDKETFGSDKLLGEADISLKDVSQNGSAEVTQPLLDSSKKSIPDCQISLSLSYDGASKQGGGDDEGGSESGAAKAGGAAAPVTTDGAGGGMMPDDGPPPKIPKPSLRNTLPTKPMDYQVRIKIWEARELKGSGIKPVTKIKIASQSKSTKVRMSNNPYWGEQFFFNFKQIPVELFEENIIFSVNSSNRLRSDALLGEFKIDIGQVWDDEKHSILKKWLLLTSPGDDSGEVKGYLKVSAMVLGAGDEAPVEDDDDEDGDVESNLLRPAGVQMQPATFWLRLYRGEDIPQMDSGGLMAVANFFTGGDDDDNSKNLVDPFVIYSFAGKRIKSSVKKETNEPAFNEQLQLGFNFPSMCQKIHLDCRDWDSLGGDDPIAVQEINLTSISVTGEGGFLPSFGPCWVNLYGAPREEGTSTLGGSHEYLNKGKGEGCAFRGRLLVELGTNLGQKPEAPILPIDQNLLSITEKFTKTRKFRLFAMVEEANMISVSVDEAVHFEISIANFGNSKDADSSCMPSTTNPIKAVFDGTHYYYIPFGVNKPLIAVDCAFEDIAYRMGPVNMALKISDAINEELEPILDLMTIKDSPETERQIAVNLLSVLGSFQTKLKPLLAEVESIEKQGNHLDIKMNAFKISELKKLLETLKKEEESENDIPQIVENIQSYTKKITDLFNTAQCSIPDAIIWMIEEDERLAYARIPAHDLFYHEREEYRGRLCSKMQTIKLRFPGKKHMKKFKVPAQIRLKLWFGLQADQKAWGTEHGDGHLSVVAETLEYQKYFPIKGWSESDPGFSDENHKLSLPKDKFSPPSDWNFSSDWYIAVDKSMDVVADDGLDEFMQDIFESEGRYPGMAWYPDKNPWVNLQGEPVTAKDEIKCPVGWEWSDEWAPDKDRAVDEDGWEYCVDLSLGGWAANEKPFHVWRRRRWVRMRIKVSDKKEVLVPAEKDIDMKKYGFEYGSAIGNTWHTLEQKLDTRKRRRWHRELLPAHEDASPVFHFTFDHGKKKDGVQPTVNVSPRTFVKFNDPRKFQLRFYLYQARDLMSADDEGYSDPYCRVCVHNRSAKSITIKKTVNPTFDQTLLFKSILLYDSDEQIKANPPQITVEVFDWDNLGSDEFLGRFTIVPIVKFSSNDHTVAELNWQPVIRFGEQFGEVLCSAELLFCGSDLPYPPPVDPKRKCMSVPSSVSPKLQRTAVEILAWGVRDLKKYQLSSVDKPEIEFEIGEYKTSSGVVKSIKQCPNFPEPILFLELMLPVLEKYMPPMNIKIKDNRAFGRRPTVAKHKIYSLADFKIAPKTMESERQFSIIDPVQALIKKPKMGDLDLTRSTRSLTLSQRSVSFQASTSDTIITMEESGEKIELKKLLDAKKKSKQKKAEKVKLLSKPAKSKKKAKPEDELPDGSNTDMDWWSKYYASRPDEKSRRKAQDYVDARLDTFTILNNELEEVPNMHAFKDFLNTFTVQELDGDEDYMGEFKGQMVLYPLPADVNDPMPLRHFRDIPSADAEEVLLRIYIIKAEGLQPMDDNGKSDPFVMITCGKQKINDEKNKIPNTLDPIYGKMYEMTVSIPTEKDLKISIWDWDALGSNDIIGETVIDLEDRLLSKHRPLCGIPQTYNVSGLNQWRDCQLPSEILDWYCTKNKMMAPIWDSNTQVVVNKVIYNLEDFEKTCPPNKESGEAKERLALFVLNEFDIVKEHIEKRSLFNPDQPDLDQGQLYMWLDMFPKSLGAPGPAFDITARKPQSFQLRIVIYNTVDTEMMDTGITGEPTSDIYVKGWIEGMEDEKQKTDIHYFATEGKGMFNWRFVFDFDYDPAEKYIVVKKKEHFWSMDVTEQHFPTRLHLQVWDNDLLSSDDFIGVLSLDFEKMIQGAKEKEKCNLKMLDSDDTKNLFQQKRMRGFWPCFREDEDTNEKKLTAKIEMEIELITFEEIDEKPAAKARDEPNNNPVLEPPKRPTLDLGALFSPFKIAKKIVRPVRWYLIGTLLMIAIISFVVYIIYITPGIAMQSMLSS